MKVNFGEQQISVKNITLQSTGQNRALKSLILQARQVEVKKRRN